MSIVILNDSYSQMCILMVGLHSQFFSTLHFNYFWILSYCN